MFLQPKLVQVSQLPNGRKPNHITDKTAGDETDVTANVYSKNRVITDV
jgi:hypothetical protein